MGRLHQPARRGRGAALPGGGPRQGEPAQAAGGRAGRLQPGGQAHEPHLLRLRHCARVPRVAHPAPAARQRAAGGRGRIGPPVPHAPRRLHRRHAHHLHRDLARLRQGGVARGPGAHHADRGRQAEGRGVPVLRHADREGEHAGGHQQHPQQRRRAQPVPARRDGADPGRCAPRGQGCGPPRHQGGHLRRVRVPGAGAPPHCARHVAHWRRLPQPLPHVPRAGELLHHRLVLRLAPGCALWRGAVLPGGQRRRERGRRRRRRGQRLRLPAAGRAGGPPVPAGRGHSPVRGARLRALPGGDQALQLHHAHLLPGAAAPVRLQAQPAALHRDGQAGALQERPHQASGDQRHGGGPADQAARPAARAGEGQGGHRGAAGAPGGGPEGSGRGGGARGKGRGRHCGGGRARGRDQGRLVRAPLPHTRQLHAPPPPTHTTLIHSTFLARSRARPSTPPTAHAAKRTWTRRFPPTTRP